jgi:adenine-specific DNA-methyltransferase
MAKKQSVTKQIPSISEEQIEELSALIPHVFTEGKIDIDKLRTTLGDFGEESPERYSFTWAGKR